MTTQRCNGTSLRRLTASAVCVAALIGPSVEAKEVKAPQTKPVVAFDIPDDWKVEKDAKNLEMTSPKKDAIIIAEVISRDKALLDAWAKQATTKLQAFGIAFDPNAKPPPKPAGVAPLEDQSAFATTPDKFSFSGKPSLATPGAKESNNPIKPGKRSIEALTGLGAEVKLPPKQQMPKLPFRAVQYYGTTFNGKPVDVQLVVYNISEKRVFVMMQESGPDDGRAVAVAVSVRRAKLPPRKESADKEPVDKPAPQQDQ